VTKKNDQTRGVFIVIEGLTGVGKSTAAELVAEKLGIHYVDPFSNEFKSVRRVLDSDPEVLDARYALFFAAVLHAGSAIDSLLSSGESVIVDSWIYRTHATHQSLGSKMNLKAPAWLPEPDVKILLTCDEEVRKARIERRGTPAEHWKRMCEDVSSQILEWYRKNIKKLIEIDVSYAAATPKEGDDSERERQISVDRMVGDIVAKVRPVIKKRNVGAQPPTAIVERYFLQQDLNDLDVQIELIRGLIKEAKELGQESTEQSSESWHDNYNFEESQRNLRMHQNTLGGLSNAREKALVVTPSQNPVTVEVGCQVTLKVVGTDRSYDMHVGSYMVCNELRERGFVSYDAAALSGLMGKKVGEVHRVKNGHEEIEVEILSIGRSPRLDR